MRKTSLWLGIGAFCLSSLLIALIAGALWFSLWHWELPPERLRAVRQHAFLKQISHVIEDFYNRTGILIGSEPSLRKRGVYPFHENLSVVVGHSVKIETVCAQGWVYVEIVIDSKTVIKSRFHELDPETVTRRRIELLLSGKTQIYSWIAKERQNIVQYAKHLYEATNLSESNLPALSCDLPKSRGELNSYLSWVKKLIGSEVLKDGFNRPFDVRIQWGTLHIRSAGADGRFGTMDDITGVAHVGKR